MKSLILRTLIGVFALAAGSAIVATGCDTGNEGQRCNPSLSHDECGGGLSCQQPTDCPENYCCPTSGTSTNPYCQPGCAGGQASICAAGGDADCPSEAGNEAPEGGSDAAAASPDSGGDGGVMDGGGG
jgi:hypothetical protein